eukprot:1195588-Prorocentrum_minimum.AAC.4
MLGLCDPSLPIEEESRLEDTHTGETSQECYGKWVGHAYLQRHSSAESTKLIYYLVRQLPERRTAPYRVTPLVRNVVWTRIGVRLPRKRCQKAFSSRWRIPSGKN